MSQSGSTMMLTVGNKPHLNIKNFRTEIKSSDIIKEELKMFNEMNNYKQTVKEGIKLENLPYKPLKDFVGYTLFVDGFFFTNGKYGRQVVVVANGAKINMPARAVETFEAIMADDEKLQAVLGGKLCIVDIKIVETKNGTTTSFKLKDR